jgi:two-component system, OmpR family, sensor histidine kinase VanS
MRADGVPRLRVPRTLRARLSLMYTALTLGIGSALVLIVYLFMRYAAAYQFGTPATLTPVDATEPVGGIGAPPADPPRLRVPSGALTISSSSDLLHTILLASVGALLVVGALGGVAGWLLTGRMLRPLQQIAAVARRAGGGRLDHRIELGGPPDEMKALSDTIDEMLAGLEQAFGAHQRFAANASHELRTPLAASQAVLDVAIADPARHTVADLARTLRTLNDRSISTVDALLDLADVGANPPTLRTVDLGTLTEEALARIAPEAAAAGIEVASRLDDAPVRADPALLGHLLSNLLQNAVRHNLPGGRVRVRVSADGGTATLSIANTGLPIDPGLVPQLTEPFVRADGRSSGRRGHGLGLALAAAVARAHGSELDLAADPAGGLTVRLDLPSQHDAV